MKYLTIKRIALFLSLSLSFSLFAQNPTDKLVQECDKALNLFVISDGGRNGYYDQKPIAETMGRCAEQLDPEAVLSGGDTFHYLGVQSVIDPLWKSNFEDVYSHPELQIPWYPVMGNHEYKGDTKAILDYSKVSRRWQMPAHYYSRVFKGDDGATIEVFFIDTPALIDKYRKKPEKYPDACKQDMQAQLKWLDEALKASRADWKLVIGHHPIYAETSKSKSERRDMQERVLPILEANSVDMYLCGHIHNYQHIRKNDSGLDFVVISSGARSRKVKPIDGTLFCSPKTGFAVLSAKDKALSLYFLDKDANVLHKISRQH